MSRNEHEVNPLNNPTPCLSFHFRFVSFRFFEVTDGDIVLLSTSCKLFLTDNSNTTTLFLFSFLLGYRVNAYQFQYVTAQNQD